MIPEMIRDRSQDAELAMHVCKKEGGQVCAGRCGRAPRGEPISQEFESDEPVSVALELHHHRLDDMLDRVEIDVEAGNWSEARRAYALFRRELEEHMRLEEELLLPALGLGPQASEGPAAVMRAEHPLIRELLEVVEIGLENEYPIGEVTDTLEAMLADHNAKEEQLLYPMFERMAGPEAYAAASSELRPLLRAQTDRAGAEAPSDAAVPLISLVHLRRTDVKGPIP